MMKKRTIRSVKMAAKVWGRMLIAGIMCAVVTVSLSVLANGLLAEEIGYQLYEQTEDGGYTDPVEYYYADGAAPSEEVKLTDGQVLNPIKKMSKGIETGVNTVLLVCSLFLLGVFPYNLLWEMGSKDENKVRYGHRRKDILRGLKVGLLANIPSILLFVGVVLGVFGLLPDSYLQVYRVLNLPFLPFINWVMGTQFADIGFGGIVGAFALVLFIPAVCFAAYWLGFVQFSLKERMTYAKTADTNNDEI